MTTPDVKKSDRLRKIPFYLVCDVSWSMTIDDRIGAVNRGLATILDSLKAQPLLADIAEFSLITFSGSAQVVIPLCNVKAAEVRPPVLSADGGTDYGAAFQQITASIATDIPRLKQTAKVYRPTVFFLTDGEPGDTTWAAGFEALTRSSPYPNVIPFGIGEADRAVLGRLVHPRDRSRLFMAKDGADPGQAVSAMLELILSTVINSGNSGLGDSEPQIVNPKMTKEISKSVDSYAADEV